MLKPLSPVEYSRLVLSLKSHARARPLSPIQISDLLTRVGEFQSRAFIAKQLAVDDALIGRFLSLKGLPDEVQSLVVFGNQKGTLSFSTAAEIANLADEDQRQVLTTAVLEYGLSKDETIAVSQRVKRGRVPVDDAVQEILRLRPIVEKRTLLIGKLPSSITKDDYKEARQKIRTYFAKNIGSNNVVSVSCKNGRFSVLLTEEGAKMQVDGMQLASDTIDKIVEHAMLRS